MTNSERRVALVRRVLDPPGDALPDWEIFARVGRALGWSEQFSWRSSAEVYDEYAAITAGRLCDVSGTSHARLRDGSLQWPVPSRREAAAHPGSERLYGSLRFPTPTARARFAATPHREPADRPTARFPLVLSTGRIAHQWHTMTRTAKSADLMAADPEPFVELHPRDAAAAGVADGQRVRLRSRHGQAVVRARMTHAVPPGTAFAPFHWGALHVGAGHGAINALVPRALDPVSRQAELKAAAVRVEPLDAEPRHAPDGARPPASTTRRRLVVVGTGMAGMATVEALLEHEDAAEWQITMLGREPDPPYNRILLSKAVAGTAQEEQLWLHRPEWLAERGITLRRGCSAQAIDLRRRVVEVGDGEELPWDRLLLATGSRPVVPPLPGRQRPGVHAFRTLRDARAIIRDAQRARRAVVIGGGLLGLEVARGLRARAVEVTVVHAADCLMERQLDRPASALLQRTLEGLGVEVLLGVQAESLNGAQTVSGVVLEDGRTLPAELVVIAAGVAPDIELARDAGLEVERGIVVDDELRTSAAGVYAVGECAQHREVVYGLWAPLLQQAKVAGASLAGAPAAFRGAVPATTLKVAGVDLFCGGSVAATPGDEEVVALDTRRGRYRRLLLRDDRLVGTILLGDLRDARALREHLAGAQRVPESLLEPIPAGVAAAPVCEQDPGAIVCTCMSVTRGELVAAIETHGVETVEQVGEHTRAGTGCGTCRAELAELLAGREATLAA
jgi:ferredoxin-nitrate reductase